MSYKKVKTVFIFDTPKCIYMKPNGTREYVKSKGEMVLLSAYIKKAEKIAAKKALASKMAKKSKASRWPNKRRSIYGGNDEDNNGLRATSKNNDPLVKFFKSLPVTKDSIGEIVAIYRESLLKKRRQKRVLKYIMPHNNMKDRINISYEIIENLLYVIEKRDIEMLLAFFNEYYKVDDNDMANLNSEEWNKLTWKAEFSTRTYDSIKLQSNKDKYNRTHIIVFDYSNLHKWVHIKYSGPQMWKESIYVHMEHIVQDIDDILGALKYSK